MSDMNEAPTDAEQGTPPELRFLKVLVTTLAGTMILGLITIIFLFVTRLPDASAPRPALPDGITLPDGAEAEAVTMGRGWIAVVTNADEILILDAESGELRQTVKINAGK
ncbi:DUF6476 family protein [Defluviimonas aestuarii]|uniref:DUF6476 family protein n=1 Tax=Albidovulum aestuarii TaxID=1130726 RepID=UPI00249C6278|nr:DUF6476 family protein [Defluviimonas aestuarii]MDI3335358.1 DUF6476 family protein [Defluviimonas aestuarii]